MSTQNVHAVAPHYTLNKLSIMIDMLPCWINGVRKNKCGMDPTLDTQVVKTSKIGVSQPK